MIDIDICLKRDNFDLCVKETFGDGITGIFGASGSGKTSLLQTISGLATPKKGYISIDEKILFDSNKKVYIPVNKRRIGYVFQEGRLFPHLTVEKNLRYAIHKKLPETIGFTQIVEMLGLQQLLKSKPAYISGGERQRTALGRSLLSSPELLLLDEPFSALDNGLRDQILPFLQIIHETVNIPMLIVSHNITDLLKLTDKLCLIDKGIIVGHGNFHHLIKNKATQKIIRRSSLINTIIMRVIKTDTKNGLTLLAFNGGKNIVKIVCEKSRKRYIAGENTTIFIRPDDIAISTMYIEQITIQNQLEGIVANVTTWDNVLICTVDVGFPLLVEITAESFNKMSINTGDKVWCMFKSVAIDVAE